MTFARIAAAVLIALTSVTATIAPAGAGGNAAYVAARWGANPTGFSR